MNPPFSVTHFSFGNPVWVGIVQQRSTNGILSAYGEPSIFSTRGVSLREFLLRETRVDRSYWIQSSICFTTRNMTTTCVPNLFCPRNRQTSEVAVRRALGLYFQKKLIEI